MLNYNNPEFMQDFYGKKGEEHILVEQEDFEIIGTLMENLGLTEL